ncbi:MAG TPA: HlyD family type I secretion periplasmic adaptor subunit [Alcaligenaceae bacterium]|nr:HlyD family type I secretion periplasmic adaptor subunit [Alcaligenaceae bacterium]
MAKNIDYFIYNQKNRGSSALIWLSLFVLVALLTWAYFAWIDEVVRGEGKVVPSSQIQVIQSLDGGVVEEILVRPGELVEIGDVLLRIDPTRYSSSLGESQAETLSLTAKAARLEAIASGMPLKMPEEITEKAPELAEMERRVWEARSNELRSNLAVAQELIHQRQQELRETRANRDQAASSCALTSQELNMTRPLLKSGAVSEVDILRLQRDVARYCGEQKAATAQLDRIQSSIQEAEERLEETEIKFRNEARTELSEVRAKLSTLKQSELALQDRVRLAEVRSPVRGTVKSLFSNTVGGVVQPGKDILEIVPIDDTLLLEVRINPRDIGFLHPGQAASVKFTAYDFVVYGGLEGVLEQLSADTITDEKGNSFYIAKVRTDDTFVGEDNRPILPGMIADVHVLTGKRTVLQYLLKPILRARENAFTER